MNFPFILRPKGEMKESNGNLVSDGEDGPENIFQILLYSRLNHPEISL